MWKSRNFPAVQFLELAKVSLLYWNSVMDNLDLLEKWSFCLHWEQREERPSPERSHMILLSSSVSFWLHAEWQEVISGLTRDYEEALEVGQWCIWEQHLIILYELNALKSLFFSVVHKQLPIKHYFCDHKQDETLKAALSEDKETSRWEKVFQLWTQMCLTSKPLGACRPLPSSSSPHILLLMPVLYSINKYDWTNRLQNRVGCFMIRTPWPLIFQIHDT